MSDFKPHVVQLERKSRDIFSPKGDSDSLIYKLLAKAERDEIPDSHQSHASGRRIHLLNKSAARDMRDFNPHHSACIDAKISSSLGLGHREDRIHEVLDPLCQFSWQDTLNALAEDFWEGGDAFLEVVRGDSRDPNLITGLFHVDATQTWIHVEEQDSNRNFHFNVEGEMLAGESAVMAPFGGLAALKSRFGTTTRLRRGRPSRAELEAARTRRLSALEGAIRDSEIIHFRNPTSRSPWYGFVDYLAATPSAELAQCLTQHEFDFYFNRAVPEFLLWLVTPHLTPKQFESIRDSLKGSQGLGNSHKSMVNHIPALPEQFEPALQKLALEGENTAEAYESKNSTTGANIVTAHGVPPALISLFIPGKMGANNEGPNSLMMFQKRKLDAAQRLFSATLACTLGRTGQRLNQPTGSPASLTRADFLGARFNSPLDDNGMPQHVSVGNGFRTIVDGINFGAMQTIAGMREPLAGSDRDPAEGRLESQNDRRPGDARGQGSRGGTGASA